MKKYLIAMAACVAIITGSIVVINHSQADGDMERIDGNEWLQARIDFYVAGLMSAYYPETLDPLDDFHRTGPIVTGTTLKVGDDVEVYGFIRGRVACAGEGRDNFMVFYVDEMGSENWAPYHVGCVTDRAPLDPEETPMPIFLDPEDPRMQQCP